MNALLETLLKIVGFDYQNKRAKDKILLEQLLELLPTNSAAINLLKNRDMGIQINVDVFTPLDNFCDIWGGDAPNKIFHVKKIEELKVVFIKSLDNFLTEYSNSIRVSGSGYVSIGIRDYEDRAEANKIHQKLNILARESYIKYEKLIKTARREV